MKRSIALRILRKQRKELAARYNVASLSLFRSIARDEARPDSAVDLLVEFSQPVGLFQFVELQQQLETLIGSKADLGTPRSLKPRLKERVLQEAIRGS
jgi:uncharacterized protein